MQCKFHPERNGVNTCNECGCWVCEDCTFERGGRNFCPDCVSQQIKGEARPVTSHSPGERVPVGRYVSWGLLFLFSVVIWLPGLNYMYLGLTKRGLIVMSAFFGALFLAISFSMFSLLFVSAMFILWLAGIFDGFKIRNKINAGEDVYDNIDDITDFLRKNKSFITGFLLILGIAALFGGMMPGIIDTVRNLLPILIAIWAINALLRKRKG